jgi:hypothetical protein
MQSAGRRPFSIDPKFVHCPGAIAPGNWTLPKFTEDKDEEIDVVFASLELSLIIAPLKVAA